ncbi:MAG TPA: hypothetical protein VF721_00510 [Pyrinomonadaceae bacterium]|jgi:Tol biopolymer transport system component
MIKSFNFRQIRAIFALAALFAFAAASFLLTPQTARMQSQITPRIAFDYNSEVRVVNADGSANTALADGFDPSWSADGTKIAYASGAESADIYVMNADGTNQRQLTEHGISYSPAFSPDGTKIAFVSEFEDGAHIYTINTDGTNEQRIDFAGDFVGEYAPAFSADGSKIVFVGTTITETGTARDEYYIANSDGSAPVRLTFIGGFNRYQASVSPDGTNILIARYNDIQRVGTDGSGVMTNLTNSAPAETDADYSPDGSQIVFRRGGAGLMIMNADGTNVTALNVLGNNPDWLPTAVSPTPTPTVTPTATPTVTPTPVLSPDLNLQVNASAQNANVGDIVTFTVNVRNNGDAATNVKVFGSVSIDGLFNQVQYTSMNAPGGCALVIGGSSVECQIGALAANQTAVVTIGVRPNVAGSLIFNLTASATEPDRNEADNSNSANVQIGTAPVCAANITSKLNIIRLPAIRNPRTGEYEQLIIARNISNQFLDPKAYFVFDNLTDGVQVAPSSNPGTTQCAAPLGSQYVTVNTGGILWRPNQTTVVRVTFTNPQRGNINYNLRVLDGANNP